MLEIREIYTAMGLNQEEADQAYQEYKKTLANSKTKEEAIKKLGLQGKHDLKAVLTGIEIAKAKITGNAVDVFKGVIGGADKTNILGRFLK